MRKLILIVLNVLVVFSCKEINCTDNLSNKIDSLKVKNDSLINVLSENKHESNYWFDGEKFIERGIANPAEFIAHKLREKPELIPLKAVLGGQMHFGNIELVSSEWLIADFNDGHVEGRGIYKYVLNANGEFEFELLEAIRPE